MAEKQFLEDELLIAHGTYTHTDIEQIGAIRQRFLSAGESSLTLDERIKLANYAYLTETSIDPHGFTSFKAEGILQKISVEIVKGIDGESEELRNKMGYPYHRCGSPSPFNIPEGFELNPESRYIDVGCGFGEVAIEVFKQVGCETYMLDPNVKNIRWAYKKLLEAGLAGNSKIKVVVSTVQDANLPLAYFDRAYLGRTIALENDKTTKEIQEGTVRLIRNDGVIAIVHIPNGKVVPASDMRTDAGITERYVNDKLGYKIQLFTVKRE